jgi:hypothetical protein
MKNYFYYTLLFLCILSCKTSQIDFTNRTWQDFTPINECQKRHECAFSHAHNKLYLLGGRGVKPVEELDPLSKKWSKMVETPLEMHHFQAVAYKNEIYVLGALTGKYPHETPIEHIWIFNPIKNEWRKGAAIPKDRLRGAAAAFAYKDKIYVACGITDGHWDGHVTWFDAYDPLSNRWEKLPDAPHARDHISGTVIGDKLYLAGGRRSSAKTQQVFQLTVPETDVFDFKTQKWTTLPASNNIPTQRAGCTSIALGNNLIVIGGESSQPKAHDEVECFDTKMQKWSPSPRLKTGRHGTQAVVLNGKIYIAAGSANKGGGPELTLVEIF